MQHCSAKATYNIKGKSDYSSSLYHYIQDSDQQKKSLAKKSELFENSNLDILDLPYGKLCTAQKQKLDGSGTLTGAAKGGKLFPPKKPAEGIFLGTFFYVCQIHSRPPISSLTNTTMYYTIKQPMLRKRSIQPKKKKITKGKKPVSRDLTELSQEGGEEGAKRQVEEKMSVCSPTIDTRVRIFSPWKCGKRIEDFLSIDISIEYLKKEKKPHMGRNKQKLGKKSRTATHNFPFTSRLNLQNTEFSFY